MVPVLIPCTQVVNVVSRPLPCSRDRSDVVSMLIPCVHLAYMVANALPCSSNCVGHGIKHRTTYFTHVHGMQNKTTYTHPRHNWYQSLYHVRNSHTWYHLQYHLHPTGPELVSSVILYAQQLHMVPMRMPPAACSLEAVSSAASRYHLYAMRLHMVPPSVGTLCLSCSQTN